MRYKDKKVRYAKALKRWGKCMVRKTDGINSETIMGRMNKNSYIVKCIIAFAITLVIALVVFAAVYPEYLKLQDEMDFCRAIEEADMYCEAEEYLVAMDIYQTAGDKYNRNGEVKEYIDYVQRKYEESVIQKASEQIEKGAYESALYEYAQGIKGLGEVTSSVLQMKYSEVEELIAKSLYEKAVELYNNGEIVEAQKLFIGFGEYQDTIIYLNQIGSQMYESANSFLLAGKYLECYRLLAYIDEKAEWITYGDALDLKQKVLRIYVEGVNQTAIDVLKERGWDDFEEYLEDSINVLYTRSDASELKNKCQPIELTKVNIHRESGYIYIGTEYSYGTGGTATRKYVDNLGNEYDYGMNRQVPNYALKSSYIEYHVTDYSCLSGYLISNYSTWNNSGVGYMTVYGDGSVIFTSPAITTEFETQYVNINITDVDIIRIEFSGDYENVSFAEPILLKYN